MRGTWDYRSRAEWKRFERSPHAIFFLLHELLPESGAGAAAFDAD